MAYKKTSHTPAVETLQYGWSGGGWSKCYTCGKVMYTGLYDMMHWAYRYGNKFCCSYTCANKAPEIDRPKVRRKAQVATQKAEAKQEKPKVKKRTTKKKTTT